MKLLYKDLNIVLAIITESEAAYAILEDNGHCEKVANNLSVNVGDWKLEGEAARPATDEEWKLYVGSNLKLTKDQVIRYGAEIFAEKISQASDEILTYWNAIERHEDVVFDDTCLILPLFTALEKYNLFGIVTAESLKLGHKVLLEALESTTTTTTQSPE